MTEVMIKSAIGKFEAFYSHSKFMSAPIAIVVNSDLPDGKMFEKPTDAIFQTFVKKNFSVLKFNFRKDKVNSKDHTNDEVNLLDLTAAVDWLHLKNIECKSFWLVAFDAGAYFGLQIVMRRPEIDNYILYSPFIRKNDLSFVVPCSSSGVLVRGSEDIRFTEDDCINLQDKLTTKTESKIKYFTIYDSERDYFGRLEKLQEETEKYIDEKMSDPSAFFHVAFNSKRRRRRKKKQDLEDEKQNWVNPIKELNLENV